MKTYRIELEVDAPDDIPSPKFDEVAEELRELAPMLRLISIQLLPKFTG